LISRREGADLVLGVTRVGGDVVDAAELGPGVPATMVELVEGGDAALERLRLATSAMDPARIGHPLIELDLAPPVGRVGKLIAVGKNYLDHAAEEGVDAPVEPVLFTKFPSSMIGHGAEITWRSADVDQVDWEAELAVVIGRGCRDVAPADALDAVLGYTCLNDVSARGIQFGDGQWVRGKSLDTFCPIGPWLVTADEVPDPQALRIRCIVNGETVQDATTGQMIHGVADLIAFCSRFMTLEPGDVIATGTPSGVGVFREPPRFLADGDDVLVEIDGIGRLQNRCRVVDG
jgi:2-keto-4-pentenoate hydratase/2-oxohepta-3-ene-1,7-dioic acid hydratase in catechol pathway